MEDHQNPFAWVTGAGQGLGRAYAIELARRGHNVLLTALPGEGLPELCTKVFVLNFSRGLYQELKGSGVFVSVVHPGPMKTNADTSGRIAKQGWRGKAGLISPDDMARRSLTQLFKKDSLILIGWMNKVNWLLMKTVPIWIRLPLITNLVKAVKF